MLRELGVVGERPAAEGALMALVDETVSLVGFLVSAALELSLLRKVVRTPGEL